MRILFILLVVSLGSGLSAAPAKAPNIVVLYSDDAGFADFGFQPNAASDMRALTPHIDRIAAEGARFTNAYMSACVCSPSRAGFMTGRYQERFGYDNNLPPGAKNGLSLAETFVSKRLQAIGTETALVGKWHLGYPAEFHPNRRGWDWFYGLLQGSRGYFPAAKPTPHRVIQENGKPTPEVGYVTDRFGDAAVRFISNEREKPFFLFVSFTAPHGPLQAKDEDLAKLSHISGVKRRKYAGLVVALDDNVGKVLKALDDADVAKNTLVVFTNDNGGQTKTGAVNTPLRGRKGQLYEGGVRVPCAMRWPGKIAKGSVIDDPVVAIDFAPTFIAAQGGAVDPAWKLDGLDLVPRLTGKVKELPRRRLYWRKGGGRGAIATRYGKWKYVNLRGGPETNSVSELYDLEGRPFGIDERRSETSRDHQRPRHAPRGVGVGIDRAAVGTGVASRRSKGVEEEASASSE